MRTLLYVFPLSMVLLAGCPLKGLDDSAADDPCASWDPAWAELEEEVLDLVNVHRAAGYTCHEGSYGPTASLTMEPRLGCAARLHSLDMGERDFFDHDTPEGTGFDERVEAQGYTNWLTIGENIAAGAETASVSVEQWMTSSTGHCGNIMNPAFEDLGVGVALVGSSTYKWYWTQDFGTLMD